MIYLVCRLGRLVTVVAMLCRWCARRISWSTSIRLLYKLLPTVSTSVALAAPHERHYYTLHDIQLHRKNNCCIRNSTVPCTLAITVSTGITKIKMRSETGPHLFLHCFTYLSHIIKRFTSCLIKIVEFFNINFLKCVFYYTSCPLNTCFPYKFIYGKMHAGFY